VVVGGSYNKVCKYSLSASIGVIACMSSIDVQDRWVASQKGDAPMSLESLSDRIVAIAFVVLGAACLAMAWGAYSAWRSRSRDRMNSPSADISQQIHFISDHYHATEVPVGTKPECPLAQHPSIEQPGTKTHDSAELVASSGSGLSR
jgi:hypothetical protein